MRIRISQWPKTLGALGSSCVPEREFDILAIDLEHLYGWLKDSRDLVLDDDCQD